MIVPDRPEAMLRTFLALGITVFAAVALAYGAQILVPVAEAIFVWFVLNALAGALRRLPWLGQYLPWSAAIAIAAAVIAILAIFAVQSSVRTIASIGATGSAGLLTAFDPLNDRLSGLFGTGEFDVVGRAFDAVGLQALLTAVVAGAVDLISKSGIVAIYVAFLLVDQQFFDQKLAALAPDPARQAAIRATLRRIGDGIQRYLWILTIVSALTAFLSYGVMRAVGLEQAGFWALVVFFLNFIPTIGSILGTLVPTVFGLLQFQEIWPTFVLLCGIGAVQFVIGNILLPRMSGDQLNISLFVTILALFVWGALWGVTGMFLAVPITAALIIVLGAFPGTRPLAILLSRTGQVEPPVPTSRA